ASFIDLSNLYDADLRHHALAAALECGHALQEGVYAGVTGPSYETKAEVSYLAQIGADAVGMSTVLEAIALREQGVRVLALSVITNAAAGVAGAVLDHAHVQEVAHAAAERMQSLILRWVERSLGASRLDFI
ncbi:MAG TPA: purine-nucleoside phosphorylase, partial [Polyangiaceae bacterium]